MTNSGLDYEHVKSKIRLGKPFTISVDNKLSEDYNQRFKMIGKEIKELNQSEEKDFSITTILFFILRFVLVILAFCNSFKLVFISSLLQFLIMPYSLAVSIIKLIELTPTLFFGNLITFPILNFILEQTLPEKFNPSITISNLFIFMFFFIDTLLCLVCMYNNPNGNAKTLGKERVAKSIFYGFINTKSYFLILFLLLRGLKMPVLAWILDAAFNFSGGISNLFNKTILNWPLLAYHNHRTAHLPYVYQHAHKFHHFLHDSSPFDAHIYGSGAPEEWHSLMLELIPGLLFNIPPPCLSYFTLMQSWSNKVFHTRIEGADPSINCHADHHSHHVKDFCWFIILDMFLKTSTMTEKFTQAGFLVTHKVEDNVSNFLFEPVKSE